MLEKLDNDQLNRLWQYKLHLEDNFYNRLSFFLVFESVLLASVGLFNNGQVLHQSIFVLRVIIILGLILTLVWGYAQAKQRYLIVDLRLYLKEIVPEYKALKERRKAKEWPISSMWLITFLVPTTVGLVWVVLFIYFVII